MSEFSSKIIVELSENHSKSKKNQKYSFGIVKEKKITSCFLYS